MSWTFTRTINPSGFGIFTVTVWNHANGHKDVTFFRGVKVKIGSMTFADPFGDATAELEFPQCSGFDQPSGDTWWLKRNVNVDITWVPATRVDNGTNPVIDPETNELGMWLHPENAVVIWEGYISNISPSLTGVSVTCQGCLYQLDRYYAKPLFPLRPKSMESMIARYFDPKRRGLWTKELKIDWTGEFPISKGFAWSRYYTYLKYAELEAKDPTLLRYVPTDMQPGTGADPYVTPWTGYLTRQTGSWDRALTGYIRACLSMMYVIPGEMISTTGLSAGDMWTITKAPGRQPLMYVRRQNAPVDAVVYYGAPGVDVQLTQDGNQVNNVIFGRGTDYDGSSWLVQNFPASGPWTMWAPIGWDHPAGGTARGASTGENASHQSIGIYHWEDTGWTSLALDSNGKPLIPNQRLRDVLYDGYDADWEREHDYWVQEKNWNNIPSGISQQEGETVAEAYIERETYPGWSGTITLQADPRDLAGNPMSKWLLRDGMVIWVKGWRGNFAEARGSVGSAYRDDPNVFHISQVTINPDEHTVTLTVDSKFRDLLSVEEALQHSRDSLAPVAMLQVGKQSSLVEDLAMSWNTNKGAGCFPPESINMPKKTTFPYEADTTTVGHRPQDIFKAKYHTTNLTKGEAVVAQRLNKNHTQSSGDLETTLADPLKPWYVPVNYGNPDEDKRWAFMQVPLSQAGTIARTEFAAYNWDGTVCTDVEFHVSMYKSLAVNVKDMPSPGYVEGNQWKDIANGTSFFNREKHAALWDGAFDKIDPATGFIWSGAQSLNYQYHLPSDQSGFMIGWGTDKRPAGYSPGSKDLGGQPTGLLMDGAPIPFDMTSNAEFGNAIQKLEAQGTPPINTSYSVTVAIYAQHPNGAAVDPKWCYIMGRFYRQVQTGK